MAEAGAGDEGFAHLHCLIKAAEADWRGRIDCPACNETCYGEVQLVRARKHWEEVRRRPVGDVERELAAELLAMSLRICIGSGEAALPLCEEVLASRRKRLGDEHSDTLAAIYSLVDLHLDMKNAAAALPLAEEIWRTCKKVHGDGDAITLQAGDQVADVHRCAGDYKAALPVCRYLVDVRRRLLGNAHLDTVTAVSSLAALHKEMAERHDSAATLPIDLEAMEPGIRGESAKATAMPLALEALRMRRQIEEEARKNIIRGLDTTGQSLIADTRALRTHHQSAETLAVMGLEYSPLKQSFRAGVSLLRTAGPEAVFDDDGAPKAIADRAAAAAEEEESEEHRPKLEPIAKKHGVAWTDIQLALRQFGVPPAEHSALFIEQVIAEVIAGNGRASKKLLRAKLRRQLEPMVMRRQVLWSDFVALLDRIDRCQELRDGAANPQAFFERLLATAAESDDEPDEEPAAKS